MKFFQIFIPLLAFTLCFSKVDAQKGKTTLGVQYSVALPMGSFKTNLSNNSYRGFQADVMYGINDKFSIGLGTGFQDFYQKYPRQLYKFTDGSDVSAVLTHSIQTTPLLAEAKYQFVTNHVVQPYAALGVGGNIISYTELLGEFGGPQTKFAFAARPEAGLYIPFSKEGQAGFRLGASYNIMPFKQDNFTNLNNLAIHAGVNIPLK